MAVNMTQSAALSLDNELVPAIIHVKQYDSGTRLIECSLYKDGTVFEIPDGAKANISGTRPDGEVFQYGSETDADVVSIDGNDVRFLVTDVMTSKAGRVPVDVTLVDGDGCFLGSFGFILNVGKAAVQNAALSTGSYSGILKLISEHIIDCSIDDDGYLEIESDDGLGVTFSMDEDGNVIMEF